MIPQQQNVWRFSAMKSLGADPVLGARFQGSRFQGFHFQRGIHPDLPQLCEHTSPCSWSARWMLGQLSEWRGRGQPPRNLHTVAPWGQARHTNPHSRRPSLRFKTPAKKSMRQAKGRWSAPRRQNAEKLTQQTNQNEHATGQPRQNGTTSPKLRRTFCGNLR